MPSGAKKRKAAKKKKEKESEINTNNISQGNNEVKSQDEKGSDGGSPSHGEHDHPFNERNEERDPSAAEEVPTKRNETEGGKEGVVVREWGMKSEESCENEDVSVGHVESTKESDCANGKSGSSYDETVTVKNTKDESDNSIKETVAFDELVKSLDSSHAKMASITQNAQIEETGDSGAESSVNSAKAVASVSEVKSTDAENVLVEKSMGSQVGVTALAVKENEDKVYHLSDQNVATSSLEEPKPKESDDKESVSLSRSPIPESTLGAEHIKDFDTPECSEKQPLVAPAPHMVQKTSWLNCCGLFEAVSGSNR